MGHTRELAHEIAVGIAGKLNFDVSQIAKLPISQLQAISILNLC